MVWKFKEMILEFGKVAVQTAFVGFYRYQVQRLAVLVGVTDCGKSFLHNKYSSKVHGSKLIRKSGNSSVLLIYIACQATHTNYEESFREGST